MKIPIATSVALFGLILIQTVLLPYLNKYLTIEEREQYEHSRKIYLVIIELILATAFIVTNVISRNIALLYVLGFLILIVVFYDSFSETIKVQALSINDHAKKIILVKNITYVLFSIIFVGSVVYQNGL